MADIFVSYSREDREAIRALSAHLAQGGWSVWWDRHILAGKDFDDVLQSELDKARAVVVVWSSHSVASRWVKVEAGEGLRRGILVPVLIDTSLPPLGFRNIQTVSFAGASLAAETPAYDELIEAVTALLGPAAPAPNSTTTAPEPRPPATPPATVPAVVQKVEVSDEQPRVRRAPVAWAIAAIVGLMVTGYFLLPFMRGTSGDRARATAPGPEAPAGQTPAPQTTSAPPPVKPVDPPPVSVSSAADAGLLADAPIRVFVRELVEAATSGDAQRVLPFYADRVDYYAMGVVGPDVIRDDKAAYYQRWPERKLELDGDPAVTPGLTPGTRTVTYRSKYDVNSPSRKVHANGTTTTILTVAAIDGRLKIVGHREQVSAARQ